MSQQVTAKRSVFEIIREGIAKRGFNKVPAIFLITYHVLLAIGLVLYFRNHVPGTGIVVTSLILLFVTGISITGGYHRYYAHTTYKTHPVVEFFLLFFASMAAQGSALRWSYDHRLHHALVDTDEDPYSINKGFWYAHMLWLLEKPRTIEKKVVADLYRNKMVMFQHTYYPFCMVATNLIAFIVAGLLFNDFLGAFVFVWWTRLFVLHHSTWFINSLAHTWGARSFCKEQTAADNYVISFLTFGEGYHNYHHTFANDYRNGVRWYHFDPTKWLIWTLSKLGLAHGLKRMSPLHIKEKMVLASKDEVTETIASLGGIDKEALTQKAQELYQSILQKLQQNRELNERYKQAKTMKDAAVSNLKEEIKALRRSIRGDWKACRNFSKNLLRKPKPQS